jgi:hypothetical protein
MRVFSLLTAGVFASYKPYMEDSVMESIELASFSADDFFSKVINIGDGEDK